MLNPPLLIAIALLAFGLPKGLAAPYENEISGAIAAVRKEILTTGKPVYTGFDSFSRIIKDELHSRIHHNDEIGITNAIDSISKRRLVNIFIEFALLKFMHDANKHESIVEELSEEETTLDVALQKYSFQRILWLLNGYRTKEELNKLIKNALENIRNRKDKNEQKVLHELTAKIQKVRQQEMLHRKEIPSVAISSSTHSKIPANKGKAGAVIEFDGKFREDHFSAPVKKEKDDGVDWIDVEQPAMSQFQF